MAGQGVDTVAPVHGLGPALDAYEDWWYARKAPADTMPDVRSLVVATNRPATATYPDLPPLPVTADGRGWHPVTRTPGQQPMVYTALLQPDHFHRSIVVAAA